MTRKQTDVKVPCDTNILNPTQQNTPLNFRRSCDFRMQEFIKHPHPSEFHSSSEFYHAALLESDQAVSTFTPQPCQLLINGKRYIPDIFYIKDHIRYVGEIKPDGKIDTEKAVLLKQFFLKYAIHFIVITNESIQEKKIEALNWLTIVRHLLNNRNLDTQTAEMAVFDQITVQGGFRMGELVDVGDRESTIYTEAAIYQLLYTGLIKTNLTSRYLDFDSELSC